MIKKYIIIGLFSVLIVFGISISVKCAKLEKENIKLKLEYVSMIDSIKTENEILEKDIKLLQTKLINNDYKIDSLKKIKQQVMVEYKYIVSKDLFDGVKTLKNNLKCEKYY